MRAPPPLLAVALALAACAGDKKPAYRTEPVSRGPIAEVVSATGDVSAIVTVNVGTQVSGTIARLHVDFNSPVRKDQLLAELDPRLFQAAVERATAGLAAAEAEVERSRVALSDAARTEQRALELAAKSLVAQAEVDAAAAARAGAAAALKAAEARVLQARAERDTARTNLTLSRIRSPIDGIVISRSVDVGQTVAASFQSPTLFLIANDLTRMEIRANIDEADVGKVKEGMTARFTVDAFPGETFEGRIREVRQAPTTIQNVVTYAAVVDAPNPERKLRQGMTASVTVVANQRESALRIPNAALRYRPPSGPDEPNGRGAGGGAAGGRGGAGVAGGPGSGPAPERGQRRARAYALVDGRPALTPLVVGISDGRQTEVVSGLAEGDQVIVGDSSATTGPTPGPRRGLF